VIEGTTGVFCALRSFLTGASGQAFFVASRRTHATHNPPQTSVVVVMHVAAALTPHTRGTPTNARHHRACQRARLLRRIPPPGFL
jgi:hypothetical protein